MLDCGMPDLGGTGTVQVIVSVVKPESWEGVRVGDKATFTPENPGATVPGLAVATKNLRLLELDVADVAIITVAG